LLRTEVFHLIETRTAPASPLALKAKVILSPGPVQQMDRLDSCAALLLTVYLSKIIE
jgi:hypothetical protein